MNIIELCLSEAKGGLELYAFRAAVELSKTDKVTGVLRKNGALQELFENNKINYIVSKVSFKPFPLMSALKLANEFVKNDVDVVHVHWVKDLPLVALAKKLSRKKPRVVFTRQMQITRNKKDFYHRFIYKEVGRFIAITKQVANDLGKYLPNFCRDKIEVLYYGVPGPEKLLQDEEKKVIRRELGVRENTFLTGLFGRIKEEKGQHLLIDAIAMLSDNDGIDATALIVGHPMKDDYLRGLKNNVISRGLGNNIIFKDFVENPQSLMQACDVIVLATYEETFGLVLAEAMRAGVAVIGSNSGGVPEIIDHNQTGLLFTPKDNVDLYEKLKILISNDELKEQFAKQGKIKADEMFDNEKHFVSLRKLLAE